MATDRRWLALGVLATALAMIVLDGTIVGVALPAIIVDLRLDLTDAQWINSLYSVVFAALLLTVGRLGDRFGRRALLVVGVVVFVAGSIAAAMAGSASALIASRALQGVGGAMILPSTLSTVNATFQGRERAAAFGVWGAVMSGAAAIGPLLGGWLTQQFSWPWIFWVNVPIGVAVVIAALLVVPETKSDDAPGGADVLGAVLSAIGFGLVVFALIEGTDLGWWRAKGSLDLFGWTWNLTLSCVPMALVMGLAAIALFIVRERRLTLSLALAKPAQRVEPTDASLEGHDEAPTHSVRSTDGAVGGILNTSLFALPTFAWGNLTAGLVAAGEFALVFVLPLYLVTSLHLLTLQSGFVLAAMAVGAFASGAAARHVAARFGAARVVVGGLALEVLGASATALVVRAQGPGWLVALALLPYGVGLGLAAAQLTSTVLRDVPVAQSGAGSATQSTVRQLGSAVGSAIGGTSLSIGLGTNAVEQVAPAAFAHAASTAVWTAVAVLILGLIGAWQVQRAAQLTPDAEGEAPAAMEPVTSA